MRDFIHIVLLFALFAVLAMQFPAVDDIDAVLQKKVDVPSFASFVVLSPSAHAAYLDAARTSWQVRNEARGRPSIGRLDSDIPLLSDTLPPPSRANISVPAREGAPVPPPSPEVYSLLPPTTGEDVPAFAVRVIRTETDHPPEESSALPAFGRKEMLSTENSRTLKEIMQ